MLIPILVSLAGLALLALLAIITVAAWIAHKMTVQERVPVSGHPSRLGLEWEDVTFHSRGDQVLLSGWYLPAPDDNQCIIQVQGLGLRIIPVVVHALNQDDALIVIRCW